MPSTATPSLLTRLLRVQWAALLLTGALCGLVSFVLTWRAVNDERDHTLEQVAQSVIRHGLESEDADAPDPPDKGQFTSQIWNSDGTLAYPADNTDGDDSPPRQPPGWHRVQWQNATWHVYTLLQDGLTIQVSQPGQTRSQAFWQIVPGLLAALVLATLGLVALLHGAARWALRPLAELREELDLDNPLQAHHPLAQRAWPEDLWPLVNTLQTLFARLGEARLAQQHLVARAAHEFRTPLAALKIHAQLLGRSADPTHDDRHRAHVLQAIARMTRLVDQLLKLAEFDAMPDEALPVRFDMCHWLAPSVQMGQTLADAQGTRLLLDLPERAELVGHPQALKALLDNVVHNALVHSHSTLPITVSLQLADHGATWQVTDHGQGIPAAQRERVGQGFVSLAGVHSEGSGLGLAIACKVAALHGGDLTLHDTPGGGLTVRIRLAFPPMADASGLPHDREPDDDPGPAH